MITRVTLTLDRDLVRAVQRLARAEGVRLSELVARELKAAVRRRRSFRQARARALKRLRDGLDLRWTPASSRDELHRRWPIRRRPPLPPAGLGFRRRPESVPQALAHRSSPR